MIRQIGLFGIIFALAAVASACASPAAPTPPAVATQGVAATRTSIPVPAQPTSATLAPRTPVAFVSPTFAVLVQPTGGASAPVASTSTRASVASAPTSAPAAVAPVAVAPAQPSAGGSVPTAPGVATGRRTEAKFVFLVPLKPAEEAEPPELILMRTELKKVPGILDVADIDEGIGAAVGYDAGLITVEQVIVRFADLKHPVKRQ